MHGNLKDSKRPDTKAMIDELERVNFSLSKRVTDLEGMLEERDVDIRSMTKRLKNQEDMENHYRGVLENFTKQAKDQYKKYENYLDNAEDLLNYSLTYFDCLHEMIQGSLDAILLDNKIDLNCYFDYENKTTVENNIRSIVDRFSKSQFLSKKKLFMDIKKKMNLKSNVKLTEITDKCQRLLEETPKQKPQKSVSLVTDDNMREEMFESAYYKLIEDMNRFKDMLSEGLYPNFSAVALSELLNSVNALSEELYKYLNRFKASMGGSDTSVESFNVDIDAIKKQLDNLEKLEYSKLIELREKNNKLQIIQNHIKNLSKENDELGAKITNNEFNLLVNNEIILAYEKSIKDKEETLRKKYQELEQAKISSEVLNQKIAKLTLELIGMFKRCRERSKPVFTDWEGWQSKGRYTGKRARTPKKAAPRSTAESYDAAK